MKITNCLLLQVEQEMKETSLQQTINNNLIDDNGNQDGNEATNKERTLRQAEMNRELQMLNKALALKEDLATRLTDNDAKFDAMRKQYEVIFMAWESLVQNTN